MFEICVQYAPKEKEWKRRNEFVWFSVKIPHLELLKRKKNSYFLALKMRKAIQFS